jgi:hypothetical protein
VAKPSAQGAFNQVRKARSKRIIRTHEFLVNAYMNSPQIRQLAAFFRGVATPVRASGSPEIPARDGRPLPATRQLAQEQSVFECGLKRACISSVERGEHNIALFTLFRCDQSSCERENRGTFHQRSEHGQACVASKPQG